MALAGNSDLYLACYHIVVYNLNPSQINDIQLTVGHYDSANMAKTSMFLNNKNSIWYLLLIHFSIPVPKFDFNTSTQAHKRRLLQ